MKTYETETTSCSPTCFKLVALEILFKQLWSCFWIIPGSAYAMQGIGWNYSSLNYLEVLLCHSVLMLSKLLVVVIVRQVFQTSPTHMKRNTRFSNLILFSSNEWHRELVLKVQFQFKVAPEVDCSSMFKFLPFKFSKYACSIKIQVLIWYTAFNMRKPLMIILIMHNYF